MKKAAVIVTELLTRNPYTEIDEGDLVVIKIDKSKVIGDIVEGKQVDYDMHLNSYPTIFNAKIVYIK